MAAAAGLVLVSVSMAVIKHRDQKQLGKERVYFSLHVRTTVAHEGKSEF